MRRFVLRVLERRLAPISTVGKVALRTSAGCDGAGPPLSGRVNEARIPNLRKRTRTHKRFPPRNVMARVGPRAATCRVRCGAGRLAGGSPDRHLSVDAFHVDDVGHSSGPGEPVRGPEGVKQDVSNILTASQIGTHHGELTGLDPTGRTGTVTGITILRLRTTRSSKAGRTGICSGFSGNSEHFHGQLSGRPHHRSQAPRRRHGRPSARVTPVVARPNSAPDNTNRPYPL